MSEEFCSIFCFLKLITVHTHISKKLIKLEEKCTAYLLHEKIGSESESTENPCIRSFNKLVSQVLPILICEVKNCAFKFFLNL